MKVFKNPIFMFLLGAIIFTGIGAYATIKLQASEIEYSEGVSIKDKIDDLYSKTNSNKVCLYISGTKGTVGSRYLCNPGDGTARYFYILKTNSNTVKLIMERNITDNTSDVTMTWNSAITYFNQDNPGYQIKQSWVNVLNVDLPDAQDIADAGGITNWTLSTATTNDWSYFGVNSTTNTNNRANYAWLYNYTKSCISYNCLVELSDSNGMPYGYWTKSLIYNDETNAWSINRDGKLGATNVSSDIYRGVRPVITINSNQLSN